MCDYSNIKDYHLLCDKCPISIIVLDANMDLLYANEKAQDLLGISIESLHSWMINVVTEDRNNILRSIKILKRQILKEINIQFRILNNFSISYITFYFTYINNIGFVGYLQDITNKQTFVEELKKIKAGVA
jgi:PAS domain S-box-containing protein